MNEYHLISARGQGDILTASLEDFGKVGCVRYTHQESMRKKFDKTKKDESIVLVEDATKWFGKDDEFREPTLRRKSTVRSEDLSGEIRDESEFSAGRINR